MSSAPSGKWSTNTKEIGWMDPTSTSTSTSLTTSSSGWQLFEGFVDVASADLDKFVPQPSKKLSHVLLGRKEVKRRYIKVKSFDSIGSNGRPMGLLELFRDDESLTPSFTVLPATINRQSDLAIELIDNENKSIAFFSKNQVIANQLHACLLEVHRKATPLSSPLVVTTVAETAKSSSLPSTNNNTTEAAMASPIAAVAAASNVVPKSPEASDSDTETFSIATRNLIKQLDASQNAFKNFAVINATIAVNSPVPNKMHNATPPSRSKAIGRQSSISELGDVKPPQRRGESRAVSSDSTSDLHAAFDLRDTARDDTALLMGGGAEQVVSAASVTIAKQGSGSSKAPLEDLVMKSLTAKNKQLEDTLKKQEKYRSQEQQNLLDKLQKAIKLNEELESKNASLLANIEDITDSLASTQEALQEMALQSDSHADKATVVERELHTLKRRFSTGPDDSFISNMSNVDDRDNSILAMSPLLSRSSENTLKMQVEHLQKRLELTEAEVGSRMQAEVLSQLSEKERRISYLETVNAQLSSEIATGKTRGNERIEELEKLSAEQNALLAGVGDQVEQISQLRQNLREAKESLSQTTFLLQQERDNSSICILELVSAKKEAESWHSEVVALKTALRSREHGREEEGVVLRDLRRAVQELTDQNNFVEIELASLKKESAAADDELAEARIEHREKERVMVSELEHIRLELKSERNLLIEATSSRDALSARVQALVGKQTLLEAEVVAVQERRAREGTESQAAQTELQERVRSLELASLESKSQVADLSNKLLIEMSAARLLKEKIASLERSLANLQKDSDVKSGRIEALEVEKIASESTISALTEVKSSTAREIASLTARIDVSVRQLASSQEMIQSDSERFQAVVVARDGLEYEAHTLKKSVLELRDMLDEERRQRASASSERDALLKTSEDLSSRDRQLEDEIAKLRCEARDREHTLRADLESAKVQLTHERNLLIEATSSRDALSARVQALVGKQTQLEAEVVAVQERRAREGTESQAAQTELQERVRSLELASLESKSQVADLSNKLLIEMSAARLLKEKIASLERSLANLQKEYDDLSVNTHVKHEEITILESRVLALEGDIESEKRRTEAVQRLVDSMRAAKDQADNEIRGLREDLNQYVKESDDVLIGHGDTIKKLIAQHEERLREEERVNVAMTEDRKSHFSKKEEKLKANIMSLAREKTSLEDSISDLQRRLEESERESARLAGRVIAANEETGRIQELHLNSLDRIEQLEMSAAYDARRRVEFETMIRRADPAGAGSALLAASGKSMQQQPQLQRRIEVDRSAAALKAQPEMESEMEREDGNSSRSRRLSIERKMVGKGWTSK